MGLCISRQKPVVEPISVGAQYDFENPMYANSGFCGGSDCIYRDLDWDLDLDLEHVDLDLDLDLDQGPKEG